jgi:hypothetical protein
MNQAVFLYISVAKEKITTKVGLESPKHINRNGHEVYQFEPLSASSFRQDSVHHLLLVNQFFGIGFSSGRMNGQSNEAVQKEKRCRAQHEPRDVPDTHWSINHTLSIA